MDTLPYITKNIGISTNISRASLYPSKHVKSGYYRPASETPSKWRFAGWPIVTRDWLLAGKIYFI